MVRTVVGYRMIPFSVLDVCVLMLIDAGWCKEPVMVVVQAYIQEKLK